MTSLPHFPTFPSHQETGTRRDQLKMGSTPFPLTLCLWYFVRPDCVHCSRSALPLQGLELLNHARLGPNLLHLSILELLSAC